MNDELDKSVVTFCVCCGVACPTEYDYYGSWCYCKACYIRLGDEAATPPNPSDTRINYNGDDPF